MLSLAAKFHLVFFLSWWWNETARFGKSSAFWRLSIETAAPIEAEKSRARRALGPPRPGLGYCGNYLPVYHAFSSSKIGRGRGGLIEPGIGGGGWPGLGPQAGQAKPAQVRPSPAGWLGPDEFQARARPSQAQGRAFMPSQALGITIYEVPVVAIWGHESLTAPSPSRCVSIQWFVPHGDLAPQNADLARLYSLRTPSFHLTVSESPDLIWTFLRTWPCSYTSLARLRMVKRSTYQYGSAVAHKCGLVSMNLPTLTISTQRPPSRPARMNWKAVEVVWGKTFRGKMEGGPQRMQATHLPHGVGLNAN
ncbi:hypothetical protein B0H13DRAFT_2268295 [Mycena leptocephala]|nr:hypothetical protein B0H13DRAFT_2268295 [Mycena leptocephala]